MPWLARSRRTMGQGTVARTAAAAVDIDARKDLVPCCPTRAGAARALGGADGV
jgi:hypothetical protein